MTEHQYKHFNPTTYGLDVKIAKVRSGNHCKYNINYHIIWIPKYRRKVLYGKVKLVLDTIIRGQLEDLNAECLADDERCRNDDHWLILKVWQRQGLYIMVDFEKWKEMHSFETIRRVRQEIQSTHDGLPGEFLPTDPDILIKRKVKEDAIRNYYGTRSWVLQAYQTKRYGLGNR